jgi:autotransporter-associated beta strand protein
MTFNNSSKNYSVTSSSGFGIAGSGALIKNGTGTLTLTTANTFTGPVVVNGGTLYANISGNPQYNANFSNISGITVNSGGTLIAGANSLFGWNGTNDKPITVNAGGTLTTDTQGDVGVSIVTLNGGTIATGAPNANAGTWRFDGAGDKLLVTDNSTVSAVNVKFQNGGCIDVADGKTLTFSGTVTDTVYFGISSVIKSGGSGILVLSGSNTYTGTTTISAGTISISANNNLGADAAPVTINGGTLKTTAYVYNTHPITIGPGGGTININSTGSGGTGQLFFNTQNTLLGSGPLTVTGNGSLTTTAPATSASPGPTPTTAISLCKAAVSSSTGPPVRSTQQQHSTSLTKANWPCKGTRQRNCPTLLRSPAARTAF